MPARSFDPDFGSALDAAVAIREKKASSVELTEHMFRRIDAHDPKLNSYVYQLRDQALAAARRADEQLARGEAAGLFHGVPANVKESFGVAGQPCTWGMPMFRSAIAAENSVAVRRMVDGAGCVLLGATNVPETLMDGQSFNEIYGTTNNPWDLSRTPGGSSGGSAASLAVGLAYFSTGSDIGGSIRSPASFCGVYGHKPTLDIVPETGQLPGGLMAPVGFSTLLAVAGPMARSAEDLEAGLQVLGGKESPDAKALRWTLPPPRHRELRDFRIGYVLEDPAVPVSPETREVLERAVRACEKAGATVKEGWPAGFRFTDLIDTYSFLLGAFDFSMKPAHVRPMIREHVLPKRPEMFRAGALASFAEWQDQNQKRIFYRGFWENYFAREADVFLLPTTFTAAFQHDHTPPDARMIPLPEGDRPAQPFWNIVKYIAPATLTGNPATTAPVGLSRSGLPVGLQIMAPYMEDGTSIEFARLLAREIGGFTPPPGY